jgi:hypothetical protein
MADYTGSFSGSFEGTFLGGVVSSSAQLSINWNSSVITNKPTTISPFQANSITSNNRFREVTFPAISASTSTRFTTIETNVSTLSGQIQAAVSGTVPPGTISGSPQIADLGYLTSASAADAGFGSGGGSTDISALNTFTGSVQTQVDNLTAETSSYLTSDDTSSFVLVSETSSMSVATASYVDPSFISASAAAAGFGSGGSTISAGTVSSSAQVVQNLVGQDVVVNSITAETYIISSSVSFITTSFSSGSTAFGDSLSDTHTFTGSVSITGSLNIGGPFTVNNENLNVSSGSIILTNSSSIVVLDSGIISGTFVGNLNYDYITNLPNLISSSAQIALLGAGILSSSAQIASQISGAFTSLSSSFASRIAALEAGSGGGSGIFALTGSFYSTTNNLQITGSLSVGSGSFKAFEVDSDGFVVLGDVDKDLNNAPVGTIAYSGSSFYLIS